VEEEFNTGGLESLMRTGLKGNIGGSSMKLHTRLDSGKRNALCMLMLPGLRPSAGNFMIFLNQYTAHGRIRL
jgi:hypothetical protein